VGSMLMVMDSAPYKYYVFDTNDKLICVGYASEKVSKYRDTFKNYFKDAGWKFELSSKDGGSHSSVYSKNDQYGGLYYTDEIVMTMIFSDDVSEQILEGADFSDLVDLG
ncbi:MAG: hypothetical protein ACI4RH_04075, partial [Huintestinicola sp.]